MIVDEMTVETKQRNHKYEMIVNPGSAYLKLMQYYFEEKKLNFLEGNIKIEIWEKFCSQFFAPNVEMNIKIFEKDSLFYEISIHNLIRFKL